MALLLDTSAVIGLIERRNARTRALIGALDEPTTRSLVVSGELLHGVLSAATDSATLRRATYDAYLRISSRRDLTLNERLVERAAEHYASFSVHASVAGIQLGMNDRWIAVEAFVAEADLVTEDSNLANAVEQWWLDNGVRCRVIIVRGKGGSQAAVTRR